MAGRKPVPTVLNLIRGNPGKRALRSNEPHPPLGADPPEWLTAEARAHWPKIATRLEDCGILTNIDADALALYCEAFVTWQRACAKVAQFGEVVKGPNGVPMSSPYLSIAYRSSEQMRKLLTEFGMTPSSRTRVSREPHGVKPEAKTGLAKYR